MKINVLCVLKSPFMWGDSKHGTWSFSIINDEGVGSGLPRIFKLPAEKVKPGGHLQNYVDRPHKP